MTDNLPAVEKKTIRGLIESPEFAAQVAKALPKHLSSDRFIRIAITALARTPKLKECTQISLFNALLSLSQLGLEPDGYHAHLVPYGDVCQLIVDYKGLVRLVKEAGDIATIHADVVCENDIFVYNLGVVERHTIDFRNSRGKMYAVYCIATDKEGINQSGVMSKIEVDAIKKRSKAGSNGPWITDYNEMAKKTVFRRLSKWLAISPKILDAFDQDFDRLPEMRVDHVEPRPLARPAEGAEVMNESQ